MITQAKADNQPASGPNAPLLEQSSSEESAQINQPPAAITKDQAAKKSLPGRTSRIALACLFACLAIAGGYKAFIYFSTTQETDDAYITAHITPVSSRLETNVDQVLIDDNQHVEKGQLLLVLDPRDFERKVDQARTELERVKREAVVAERNVTLAAMDAQASRLNARGDIYSSASAIQKASAAIREAEFSLAEQKNILAQKEAERVRAEEDFKRFLRLESLGAVTTSERDAARRDFDVAKAACEAAKRSIDQKQAVIEESKEQLKIAQAQRLQAQGTERTAQSRAIQTNVSQLQSDVSRAAIKEAEAKLADAELKLSYCRIYAPVAGRIGRKTVELGQRVQTGARLFTLTEDRMWVVANFKENQLEKMRAGQKVEIKVDSLPHKKFSGTVESFSPGSGAQFTLLPPDNATGNFTKIVQRIPVKILFDKSINGYEDRLVPGLSVIATVKVN